MDESLIPRLDEDRYRQEVLQFPSEQSEHDAEQQLIEEARKLDLKLPEVEIAASLAASMAFGIVDINGTSSASRPSIERSSVSDVVSSRATSIDQLVTSLSATTVASDKAHSSSTRSGASNSTRPTSYCSVESRRGPSRERDQAHQIERSDSAPSARSPSTREGKRASFIHAMGKLPFRKKRRESTVLLPSSAQITVKKGGNEVDKVCIETKRERTPTTDQKEEEDTIKVEVPIFDDAALQRSTQDPLLRSMVESHRAQACRHISFQRELLRTLSESHEKYVAERRNEHEREVNEKREKNIADAGRIEERQLAAEIEQEMEFEKAKMNSRTRIKHMEGYCIGHSPPTTPGSENGSDSERARMRKITRQQKEQLAQEYHDRDSMDRLHQAKIKVLRDRQEIQLQEAMTRMERELNALIDKHSTELAGLQKDHHQREELLVQALDLRKAKMKSRWNLEQAILRRRLELEHGQPYGPLPPLSFADLDNKTPNSVKEWD
ncbi:hypothetical protein ANI_1_3258024 [Paecilomyces variotii No. 5]|uniref:Uncharacterized protein n=1 Tax=Byssochlamys spectabilis (strain No. 5 / NBRC 109023) TaxID=1356009 RepID=V5FRT4_BYSSN|nr:hypothetical protein ANI_1_3258024 [Paecilomyces variotii No. 5]